MFELDIGQEFYIFLIAINQGLLIGLIYDINKLLRYNFKRKRIRTFIEDLLFWIIIIGIFFIFILQNTDGIVRGYIILGFLIGYLIYIKFISKYNFPLINKIFQLILKGINEIINIIGYPFKVAKRNLRLKLSKWIGLPKILLKEMKRYYRIISKKK